MDYKIINTILEDSRRARQRGDWFKLVSNAEAILEYLTPIIDYEVEQESQYRKFEAQLSTEKDENGKRYTGAYCETQAKATDFYKEYRRALLMREHMYEVVQTCKKLAGSIDKEINAQIK